MIITCPHCQTQYQVTYDAIGSAGRKVQCAHCQRAWQQGPLDAETPASPEAAAASGAIVEDALDEAMVAEEQAVAAELAKKQAAAAVTAKQSEAAGKVDPDVIRKRQRAFSQRQHHMIAHLPTARVRRAARWGLALALAGLVAGLYFGRVAVVARFPAMAGVYEAVGLKVNVFGLEFSNLTTLRTLREGKEMLLVSAQIVGLEPRPMPVPPVVVTLVDSNGEGVFEWSVIPSVRDLMAGERATFDTQLILPPGDAARVRLSFDGDSPREALPEPAAGAGEHTEAGTPADGHAAPTDDHGGPADGHAAPTEEHGAPADAHGAPVDPHAAAAEGHAAPADAHAAPAEDHAAPAADHAAPTQDHAAPADQHAAPAEDHAAPAADHGASAAPAPPEHH